MKLKIRLTHALPMKRFFLLPGAGLIISATALSTPLDYRDQLTALLANEESLDDTQRLEKLFEVEWRHSLAEFPEFATYVGVAGSDDRWTDYSRDAIERRKLEARLPLPVVDSIERAKLSERDQLHYDLFRRSLLLGLEFQAFPEELMPINQLGGMQQDAAQLLEQMPKATTRHYDNIVSRLRGLAIVIDQHIELMKRGVSAGVTPPRITLRAVPEQVARMTPEQPWESPLLESFSRFPESIPGSEQERLRKEALAAYEEKAAPAFRRLGEYLSKEYLPSARETIAFNRLSRGDEWYALRVRATTTTNLSPRDIYDIGQREVKRIRGEMEGVMKEAGFSGTFEEFLQFLRTDSRFYFKKDTALLQAYRDIAKRIDPELPKLFGKLPRLPYGIRPVPAAAQESQTTAYYNAGSLKAGRAGYFYANTYNLATRPSWEMEALTLHEAVPGHHLQIALAQELEDVPEFRRYDSYTAYVEGWGLYAESLGAELGLYTDPYSRFGKLAYEMWRACRLVVDTGIHAFGWSRERSIEFMKTQTGKSEHDITVEVDRYIVWPSQALAYKIGQLKIRELRDHASTALGERFDVRRFHDLVLGNGALPLDVLETSVKEWIATQKAAGAPAP